jgi:hypothetical protein
MLAPGLTHLHEIRIIIILYNFPLDEVRTSDINGIQINGNDDWYVILLSN